MLFEHQRTNNVWMALRLLAYMVRIWDRHALEHPNAKLPLIVPVVLAQVEGGWSAPRRFSELFDLPEDSDLRELLPDFRYEVDDLSLLSDDELAARGLADFPSLALWLMRDVWDPEAIFRGLELRAGTFASLLKGPHGAGFLFRLLRFVALAADGLPRERFYAKLFELVPSTEPYAMTIAEELRREGEIRGRAEGKAEGESRGQRRALLAVLEARGFHVPEDARAKVDVCEDVEQLTDWTRRAVTVASVDELLDQRGSRAR